MHNASLDDSTWLRERGQIVEDFEKAWREGQRPDLAEYLSRVDLKKYQHDPQRIKSELFRSLLRVEFSRLIKSNETLVPSDYKGRFPGYEALIDAAHSEAEAERRSRDLPEFRDGPQVRATLGKLAGGDASGSQVNGSGTDGANTPKERMKRKLARLKLVTEGEWDAAEKVAGPTRGPGAILGLLQQIPITPTNRFGRGGEKETALTAYQVKEIREGRAAGLLLMSYVIRDSLGHGGMGAVYKAWDLSTGRWTAIKRLSGELAEKNKKRFRHEIKAAASLNHPNFVHIYTANLEVNPPYFAMEFVAGQTLAKAVEQRTALKGGCEIGWVVDRMIALTQVLQVMHRQGMIHRDIKPGNVMLTADGEQVKLLDLGLVHLVGDTMTSSHWTMGTWPFIAPEQINDAKRAREPADLYSLGCTFYYALASRPPFVCERPEEYVYRHLNTPAEDIRQVRPDVPRPLAELILSALGKRPEHRCTVDQFVDALTHWRGGEKAGPPGARVVGPTGFPADAGVPGWPDTVYGTISARERVDAAAVVPSRTASAASPSSDNGGPLGEEDKQIRALNDAIRDHPDEATLYHDRGVVYTRKGNWAAAMADFNHAIKVAPSLGVCYGSRGMCLVAQGDNAAALDDFTHALSIMPTPTDHSPTHAAIYHNQGLAFLRMSRPAQAITSFQAAIRLDRTLASAYLNQGLAHVQMGDYAAAVEAFNKCLEVDPQNRQAIQERDRAEMKLM